MKRNITLPILPLVVCLVLLTGLFALFWTGNPNRAQAQDVAASPAAPSTTIGSAFTYQGYLQQSGTPVDGVACDFYFALWTEITGGTQYGTQTINGVNVNEGVFAVQIDIGNVFTGDEVWLETAVQCPGDPNFTTLTPRQPITAVPYALSLQPGAVVDSNSEPVGLSVKANATTNQIALYAEANQDDSVAVYGNSANNTAVFGNSGIGRGVWGQSTDAEGVYGYSVNNYGVYGYSNNDEGVYGYSVNDYGVHGESDNQNGVYGESDNDSGVLGISNSDAGVSGISFSAEGVYGQSTAINQAGVYGLNQSPNSIGVWGQADNSGGVGVYGSSTNNTGVYGESSDGTGLWGASTNSYGVYGSGYTGVYGISSGTAVHGFTTGNGYGIYGSNGGSNTVGHAGSFNGRVSITGNLSKSGGSFKIDHPLDPANQYLYHSFVESPDMMNIYNGNITTDAEGYATVTMPDYFEALNADFRYQLTVIGQFAQAIVAREIEGNQFVIQTDKPQVTVSWQVTGIRHDAYANMNRIPVEEEKSAAEKGFYLHPEAFGLAADAGIADQTEQIEPRQ